MTAPLTPTNAEEYLRNRYGAYRGHHAWRELEEAFNAGRAALSSQAGKQEPQFDAMVHEQEKLAVQFCEEIAGKRGKKHSLPDPVRLLEMAEALYRAEHNASPQATPVSKPVRTPENTLSDLTEAEVTMLRREIHNLKRHIEDYCKPISDHIIAHMVNRIKDVAIRFHDSQQLREHIRAIVVPMLRTDVSAVAQEQPSQDSAPTDRDAFEAWAESEKFNTQRDADCHDTYVNPYARMAWSSWQEATRQARARAAPDGRESAINDVIALCNHDLCKTTIANLLLQIRHLPAPMPSKEQR